MSINEFFVVFFAGCVLFSLVSPVLFMRDKPVNQYKRDVARSYIRFAQFLALLLMTVVFDAPIDLVEKMIQMMGL